MYHGRTYFQSTVVPLHDEELKYDIIIVKSLAPI
jgi:hypothetical protein